MQPWQQGRDLRMRVCILISVYTCVYIETYVFWCVCVCVCTQSATVKASCQWPFIIVCDVDAVLGGRADDELGALVKKLSSLSLRCSGSSSVTLASSMSLFMAAMSASVKNRNEREMKTCRKEVRCKENNNWVYKKGEILDLWVQAYKNRSVCVCVCVRAVSYQVSCSFSLDGCSPPRQHWESPHKSLL